MKQELTSCPPLGGGGWDGSPRVQRGPHSWGNFQEAQSILKSRSPAGSEGESWLAPWLSKALGVELGFPRKEQEGPSAA